MGRKFYTKMLILIVWEIGFELVFPTFLYLIRDFPKNGAGLKKEKWKEMERERERETGVEDGLERIEEKCLLNHELLEIALWIDI